MGQKPPHAIVPLKVHKHEIILIFFSLKSNHVVIKGTVSRDFLLLDFFMISFPQAPDYTNRAASNFFENSWRLFTAQGLPPVSVANGKKLQAEIFV